MEVLNLKAPQVVMLNKSKILSWDLSNFLNSVVSKENTTHGILINSERRKKREKFLLNYLKKAAVREPIPPC